MVLLHRYTTKVQKELELDEKALSNLQADRQRFLCKAVENYVQCLEEGEEHDTWVFRLASLWLENGDVAAVNATMKVGQVRGEASTSPPGGRLLTTSSALQKGVKKIPSHKFLPLMYQLAARMGTKMASGTAEDRGFHGVLYIVRIRPSSVNIKPKLLLHLPFGLTADQQSVSGAPSPHALHHLSPGKRQQRQGLLQGARVQGRALAVLATRPGENLGPLLQGLEEEELTRRH